MTGATVETIETMLESVQQEVDDPELRFKLRTARQLLLLLEEQHDLGRKALADADLDADVREDLRTLGYLE